MDYDRLRAVSLFEGVSDEDLRNIEPFVSSVEVSEGKHLVDEGDFSYQLMAIEDGQAEVLRGGDKIAELGPGDFFGEMALSGDARRNASVVAVSPVTSIVITRQAFRQMRNDIPTVCDRVQAAVEDRGRELVEE